MRVAAYFLRIICSLLVLTVLTSGVSMPAHAQTNTAISVGYQTAEQDIAPGALVSLAGGSENTIELATPEKAERLVGIIDRNPLIELSSNQKQVQVATSGVSLALVSDMNGDVKAGDTVTASPAKGVGMKATVDTQAVGIAQADLSAVATQTKTVVDRDDKSQTIKVGLVPVQVSVAYFKASEKQASFLPAFLQELANGITGREVPAVRVVVGLVVLLAGIFGTGALLYAAVRSSIISIGRNPLSSGAVHKGLLQVSIVAIAILLVMLGSIYLILTV